MECAYAGDGGTEYPYAGDGDSRTTGGGGGAPKGMLTTRTCAAATSKTGTTGAAMGSMPDNRSITRFRFVKATVCNRSTVATK